jgi:hypothetical protein
MLKLNLDRMSSLIRTGSVKRVLAKQDRPGGWRLVIEHADLGQTAELYSKRGDIRLFTTADALIRTMRVAGWTGDIAFVLQAQSASSKTSTYEFQI